MAAVMFGLIFIIAGYIPLLFETGAMAAQVDNSSQYIIEKIFDGYNEKTSPTFGSANGETQVKINMSILIVSMYSIRESSMDYSISLFLRQFWYDTRLAYSRMNYENLTRLELDPRHNNIWVPDVYVLNEKSAHFHEVTVPNRLIHIYPDGGIRYVVRITGVFACQMQLQKYPFDSQECVIEFESFGHSTDNIDFNWVESPVDRTMALDFPQFTLVEYSPYRCTRDYYGIEYPCLGVRFYLQRNYGYHVIQIYVPSILIVVLSWLNFWLDCTSAPARISLGLLTVLTMTTQLSGARADLPRVSYIKAIDAWMAACLAFVVFGLMEFAYVNVLTRTAKQSNHSKTKSNDETAKAQFLKVNFEGEREKRSWTMTCWCFNNAEGIKRAVLVDKISRVLFPCAFLTFNLIYWIKYVVL